MEPDEPARRFWSDFCARTGTPHELAVRAPGVLAPPGGPPPRAFDESAETVVFERFDVVRPPRAPDGDSG